MKRILVPVDFSEYSLEALKVAAQIARKNNFEIILLHLLELPHQASDDFGNGNSIPEIIFFKNKAIGKLEELMDSKFLKGIDVFESIEFKKVVYPYNICKLKLKPIGILSIITNMKRFYSRRLFDI